MNARAQNKFSRDVKRLNFWSLLTRKWNSLGRLGVLVVHSVLLTVHCQGGQEIREKSAKISSLIWSAEKVKWMKIYFVTCRVGGPHSEKLLPSAWNARGRGQHLQARGHSFSLYGLTLSRQITCLFLLSAVNWFYRLQMGLFTWLGHWIGLLAKNFRNELGTRILDKETCIKELIFLDLLYVSYEYTFSKIVLPV